MAANPTTIDMQGRVILVTGAGGGIGRDVATLLAGCGSPVVLVDRNAELLQTACADIRAEGGDVTAYAADISQADEVGDLLARITTEVGLVQGLVSAAGIHRTVPLLDLDPAEFRQVLQVNLEGTLLVVQEVGRRLMAESASGSMVLIASLAGRAPRPANAHYAASKAGVISLVQSAAAALSPKVRVNGICPGTIDTPMLRHSLEVQERAEKLGLAEGQDYLDQSPTRALLGRHGTPRDISHAVAFLLSEQASYITGQTINVDGGVLFN